MGLIYLTSHGNPVELVRDGVHIGDALMLVAAVANALYGVPLRRWALTLPIWQQMFWQIVAATLLLALIWLLGTISPITHQNAPLILYEAVPTSLVARACWMFAIARLEAARTAMTINLLPPRSWPRWLGCISVNNFTPITTSAGGVLLLGVVVGLREWEFGRTRKDRPATAVWKTEKL